MADDAIEDDDYEGLPIGTGMGVNMMAGALVSVPLLDVHQFELDEHI